MSQELGVGLEFKELAKAYAKAEEELKIEAYVAISICKKVDGEQVVLYRYDLPRQSVERWRWVINWRKAKFVCADPRSYIYTTMCFYDKTRGEMYGFGSDLSQLVALKGKITLQENRVAAYIKANQGNLFFDEAIDPALQKIRAKVELAKERVALAEARLKVKIEKYQTNIYKHV